MDSKNQEWDGGLSHGTRKGKRVVTGGGKYSKILGGSVTQKGKGSRSGPIV